MADLTQAIQALQYGPLFDMMDRRTGASLLMVNKPISKMVSAYVNATGGFKPPAFEGHGDHCIIRYNDMAMKILTRPDFYGFIKCKWIIIAAPRTYTFHVYDCMGTITETIALDKDCFNAVVSSYKEYVKLFVPRY